MARNNRLIVCFVGFVCTFCCKGAVADKLPVTVKQQLLAQQYQQVLPLLTALAQTGNSQAQYQLALCYLNGLGVDVAPSKAEQWLLKAGERNAKASYLLGSLYAQGRRLDKDRVKAKKWLLIAKASGNRSAQKRLDKYGLSKKSLNEKLKISVVSLHEAVKQGKLNEVVKLVAQGTKLDDEDPQGNTALMIALKHNQQKVALYLLRNKVAINVQNHQQKTPLMMAVLAGNRVMAQRLINENADVKVADKQGKTALTHAIAVSMNLVVNSQKQQRSQPSLWQKRKALIAQAADKNSPYSGWSALSIAVAQNKKTMVGYLLNKGQSPANKFEALAVAINQDSSELFSLLLSLLQQDQTLDTEQTAQLFFLAIKYNRSFMVDALLKNSGSNQIINAAFNNLPITQSPLWHAIMFNQVEIFAAVAAQLPPDDRQDDKQRSLLLLAAQRHLPEIIQMLIGNDRYGDVDTNLVDDRGRSALWYAADFGDTELIELLIGAKSRVGQADLQGYTPMMRAVINNCYICVATLLLHGADQQKQSATGNSALMFAAQGKDKILALFLKGHFKTKLDLTARNKQSLTPLMLAVKSQCSQCVRLLLGAGANPYRKNASGENAFDMAQQNQAVLQALSKS